MAGGIDRLVDPDAELRELGRGFGFTEGPVWIAAEQALEFVDIPGDVRWRWTQGSGMQQALAPMFKASGLALDVDGHLLAAEGLASTVSRYRGAVRETVAYHYEGAYLNSPNDLAVRSDGSIYFTDPDYGRWNDWIGQERTRNGTGFRGVYRVPPDGGPLQLVVDRDEFDEPNGIAFSPDETLLYVNDSVARNVKVFDVQPDGSLRDGRVLAEGIGTGVPRSGNVDGMECDELGNVWTTGPGGVWVLSPAGEHLGTLATPEVCGSLTWGGPDLRSLFLMTSTTVHVVRTIVGPAPLPPRG
jgi:gluconolactonase